MTGMVGANSRMDLTATLFVPPAAPSGHYEIKVKAGIFPSNAIDENSFEFDIPAP
jgi:hypothetical protein